MSRVRSITRRTGSRRPAVRIAIVIEGSLGDPEVVEASYANAVARATESVARREADGDPAGNPSTTVHDLTEFIRSTVDRLEREE